MFPNSDSEHLIWEDQFTKPLVFSRQTNGSFLTLRNVCEER